MVSIISYNILFLLFGRYHTPLSMDSETAAVIWKDLHESDIRVKAIIFKQNSYAPITSEWTTLKRLHKEEIEHRQSLLQQLEKLCVTNI